MNSGDSVSVDCRYLFDPHLAGICLGIQEVFQIPVQQAQVEARFKGETFLKLFTITISMPKFVSSFVTHAYNTGVI